MDATQRNAWIYALTPGTTRQRRFAYRKRTSAAVRWTAPRSIHGRDSSPIRLHCMLYMHTAGRIIRNWPLGCASPCSFWIIIGFGWLVSIILKCNKSIIEWFFISKSKPKNLIVSSVQDRACVKTYKSTNLGMINCKNLKDIYLLKINWDMYSDSDREDRSLHASQRLKKRIKHVIR